MEAAGWHPLPPLSRSLPPTVRSTSRSWAGNPQHFCGESQSLFLEQRRHFSIELQASSTANPSCKQAAEEPQTMQVPHSRTSSVKLSQLPCGSWLCISSEAVKARGRAKISKASSQARPKSHISMKELKTCGMSSGRRAQVAVAYVRLALPKPRAISVKNECLPENAPLHELQGLRDIACFVLVVHTTEPATPW